jgi:hypothetical protein
VDLFLRFAVYLLLFFPSLPLLFDGLAGIIHLPLLKLLLFHSFQLSLLIVIVLNSSFIVLHRIWRIIGLVRWDLFFSVAVGSLCLNWSVFHKVSTDLRVSCSVYSFLFSYYFSFLHQVFLYWLSIAIAFGIVPHLSHSFLLWRFLQLLLDLLR